MCNLERRIPNSQHYSEADIIYSELTTYVREQRLTTSTPAYLNLAYVYSGFSSYHFFKVNILTVP